MAPSDEAGASAAEHLRLADQLHDQGRLAEAIARYASALALEPDNVEAHNNQGAAFQSAGDLASAVASFRRALALGAASPYLHFNLGSALQAQGALEDAIAQYGASLALQPEFVDAHFNRANAFKDLGRWPEAIRGYTAVVTLRPDAAQAHNNLGWVLQAAGRMDDAIACYRLALSLAPAMAVAHHNLGTALEASGQVDEALPHFQHAIALQDAAPFKASFARAIRSAAFTRADQGTRALVARAISEPWARPVDLAPAAIRLLKQGGDARADDPLLHALLENAPVTDVALERLLGRARRALIEEAARGGNPCRAPAPFDFALARQCFLNEYVYGLDNGELAAASALREKLALALQRNEEIAPLQVVAIATYFPLLPLDSAGALRDRPWPERMRELLELHIAEPVRERAYRDAMPALTPIGAGVSASVRQQYEENPYPRWSKLPPAVSLKAGIIDLLVAGCGTGRESIELARQFEGARVLAVDLSRSSLAYAQRKSVELGIANVEYAQADISLLGTLGRNFDFISSVGVLHHLEDPAAGLRQLRALLRPGGTMLLGLYSEAARRGVVAARELIAARGHAPDAAGIRRCREELMSLGDLEPAKQVLAFNDFYVTSECRDLLFHVQEHRFTLPRVKEMLAAAALEFAGFVLEPRVMAAFAERFPGEGAATDLDRWHEFEAAYPDVFAGMYIFTCR